MRPHEVAKDVMLCHLLLAPPVTESGTRCSAKHGESCLMLEMISAIIDEHGALLSPSTYSTMVVGLCAQGGGGWRAQGVLYNDPKGMSGG
jgi:hypothetical protein